MQRLLFKYSFALGLCITLLLHFSCRKKEVNPDISLSFNLVGNYVGISVHDTLNCAGTVKGTEFVTAISITLCDQNMAPVQAGISIIPNGKETSFSNRFVISNTKLESGAYKLVLTANIGTYSERSILDLQINALPLYLKGFYVVSSNGLQTQLSRLDTAGNYSFNQTFPQPWSGTYISNYNEFFILNGGGNQALRAFDINTNAQIFSHPYQGTGLPYFTCITGDQKYAYVGYYDGFFCKTDKYGNVPVVYAMPSTDHAPDCAGICGNFLVAHFNSKYLSQSKLAYWSLNNPTALNELPFYRNVMGFYPKSANECFVVGNNSSGQAYIAVYNFTSNSFYHPLSSLSQTLISSCSIDNDRLLLCLSDGQTYLFQYSTLNLVSLANTGLVSKVWYDSYLNLLFCATDKTLKSFQYSGFSLSLKKIIQHTDTIKGFEPVILP